MSVHSPEGQVSTARLLAQPLADDLRHPVALHGDAVQRVGDLHRPLLVRDHDQLRGSPGAPP